MTSLAVFPTLRRTLTDVMEDELYDVPQHFSNCQQQPSQQQQQQQPQQQQQQQQQPNMNFWKQSPSFTQPKLYRNPSAMNSEEMLTIPDDYTHLPHFQPNHTTTTQPGIMSPLHNTVHPEQLQRVPSHDMYFDIPDEPRNVFNEFANPNLTTTNQNLDYDLQPMDASNQPQKLLKFNEDLTLEYFNNDDESQFVVFPGSLSPNMIPEDIEDEELSDDDDDDDFDMTYLDDSTITQIASSQLENNMLQPSQQVEQLEQPKTQAEQPTSNTHYHPQQFLHDTRPNLSRDSTELESDVDRMSLASDDEDTSDSVLEEDEPSFKSKMKTKKRAFSISNQPQKQQLISPTPNTTTTTSEMMRSSPSDENGQHQCTLINPSNGEMCLKQFSRPYDLIRHQETIHASRKKVFRCMVCNQLEGGLSKKTFSRGDALSRHVRVKHG
ncbi:Transcriptional regulator RPN4 [Cyberlindnera fabianii]|uniref:Transcriptional regulator RPN4 n=1 Tax=Cyberlindnera fabianii TaxID=36022 RepID=A0A1V2L0U4_CYBFA|nr:Transcriptional regulator RPN4 [Cyberlindnera fabianii]